MTRQWAATNTLREAQRYISEAQMGSAAIEQVLDRHAAALALVENALGAAEGVMKQMDYETPHHSRLAAALRAVREGK